MLLTLIVLALAGLQLVRPTDTLCTVFVVDVSDSIAPAQRSVVLHYIKEATRRMRSGDRAALVAFGAEALLDHAPEDRAVIGNIVSIPTTSRTDIAAGIQLAMAGFPAEMGKQIVLFSDGNENLGDGREQASLALSNDVRISVVPLQRDTARGEALILRTETPLEAKQGAPFPVTVLLESLQETDGTVTLLRNKEVVEKRAVHLAAGKTVVAFEQSVPNSGLYRYQVILDVPTEYDVVPDNNVAYAYTRVAGKPHVLVIEGTPGDGAQLAQALRDKQVAVELGGPDRIPASLPETELYDSLVFANVPAWKMAPAQMAIIQSAVRDTGMGFAMVGGEESFGAGGYLNTPLEQALPVTMDMKKKKVLPSLALVIVIDVSGSMSADENGVPKIRLAAEAAKAAVELLQPIDQVCVIGYSTPDAFVYAVNMRRADNKPAINAQLDKLAPGGGGIMGYSSLKEAYRTILTAPTQSKHVIYCADASDDEEHGDAVNLAHEMQKAGVTISTIGFGTKQDKDWPHFQQVAHAGGGNAYLAERLSNLPQIFTRDVMFVGKSPLVEEPFQVRTHDVTHPITRGIPWTAAPPLRGYVATTLKPTPSAQLLMTSHQNDPVLAAWQYGLGRTLAFTPDATGHWATAWLDWDGYAPFWAQALRWTMRRSGTTAFQTLVTEENGQATISVEAVTPDGDYRNLLDLRAHIAHVTTEGLITPRIEREEVPLPQTAPGHYEAGFQTRGTGAYMVTVEERRGGKTAATQMANLVIPYSPEYQAVRVNPNLLAEIAERAGGKVNPPPADIFTRLRFGSRQLRDLWVWLLLAAGILFVFDVAVRRILLPWGAFATVIRELIVARLPHRPTVASVPVHAPTLGTLLSTRPDVRRRQDTPPVATIVLPAPEENSAESVPPSPAPTEPPSTVGTLLQRQRNRKQR